mgnify:CR=1|jgi:hypothetical protein
MFNNTKNHHLFAKTISLWQHFKLNTCKADTKFPYLIFSEKGIENY